MLDLHEEICPEAIIIMTACDWSGPRRDLLDHIHNCEFCEEEPEDCANDYEQLEDLYADDVEDQEEIIDLTNDN